MKLSLHHAYTPTETGNYGGGDHLVVDDALVSGRLQRKAGDALCKPSAKFWGLHRVEPKNRRVCKRCRAIAVRLGFADAVERLTSAAFDAECIEVQP